MGEEVWLFLERVQRGEPQGECVAHTLPTQRQPSFLNIPTITPHMKNDPH